MRFDEVIRFYGGNKRYDFHTSQQTGQTAPVSEVMGNVTDLGAERSMRLFGSIKQGVKIVRLIEPIAFKWAYLTIGDSSKKYRLQTATKPLKNYTLIVGEDVG